MDIRKAILFLVLHVYLPYLISGQNIPECRKEIKNSYLDIAMEMIKKARDTNYIYPKVQLEALYCVEVMTNGHNASGIYNVFPKSRVLNRKSVEVFCDMDTDGGGWTLIQRRGNFTRAKDYFFQDWISYKNGFGDIEKDFWLGNDNIFALSNQKLYSVRFDLKDVEGNKRYAVYDTFWIDDEDHKYTLHIKGYSGDAGDSMASAHDSQSFSTSDQDNDKEPRSCSELFKGGWWYNSCHHANLNGLYLRGKHDSYADGVIWHSWKGHHESMDTTEIKIRPKGFRTSLPANIVTPE